MFVLIRVLIKLAKQKNVDIQLYSVIYELVDDVRNQLTGMLESRYEEKAIGNAEILKVFMIKGKKNLWLSCDKRDYKIGGTSSCLS